MSKRKLLLADDSVTVQKVVNLAFESEDIEVITASDGNTAFEKFVEFSPDLVLADINLPGANGYEICERIKQEEQTKHIPVVLLVGSFAPFSEERAERIGASGFLKKPFQSIGLLINKVTDLLGAGEEDTLTEGGFNEADTQPIPVYETSEDDYSISDEFGDDEMIETERVGEYSLVDETSKYETNADFEEMPDDSENSQPMTFTEVEEAGLADQFEETSEPSIYEFADEPDDSQSAPAYDFDEESENSAEQHKSYDEYSAYQQPEESEDLPSPQAISALDLDDMELLELPPLHTFPETSENAEEENLRPAVDDYYDYTETTAKESSLSENAESAETDENYDTPTEETAVNFDSWTNQTENETQEPETAENHYSDESETLAAKEFSGSVEEEIPASYDEQPAAQYVAEEETETQAMISEETNREISKTSDNELVVHYFPPEVIDQIAERVVEKLAEKLGK